MFPLPTPENVKARLAAIRASRPDYTPLLDLYEKVLLCVSEVLCSCDPDPGVPTRLDPCAFREAMAAGHPLLIKKDFPIDEGLVSRLFTAVAQLLAGEPAFDVEAWPIRAAVEAGQIDISRIVSAMREDDDKQVRKIADDLDLDPELVGFIATRSIRPAVRRLTAPLQDEFARSAWEGRGCPICGSIPAMAFLEKEEGARFLLCSFCEAIWRAPRMECPFCGETDDGKLNYLYLDEDPEYLIAACRTCKRYLKTLDTRKLEGEAVPAVEDLASLHLDILAAGDGGDKMQK